MRNFLNRAIGIINFVWLFQNFIDDTVLKVLLQQGISEPVFYGNVIYENWKIAGECICLVYGTTQNKTNKKKKKKKID